jgi:hypothetical protein
MTKHPDCLLIVYRALRTDADALGAGAAEHAVAALKGRLTVCSYGIRAEHWRVTVRSYGAG